MGFPLCRAGRGSAGLRLAGTGISTRRRYRCPGEGRQTRPFACRAGHATSEREETRRCGVAVGGGAPGGDSRARRARFGGDQFGGAAPRLGTLGRRRALLASVVYV